MISIIKCIYDSYSSCAQRMDKQRLQPPTDIYQLFLNVNKQDNSYHNYPKLEIFSYAYGKQEIFEHINQFVQQNLTAFNPEIGSNEYASYYIRTHMNSNCQCQIDINLIQGNSPMNYQLLLKPTFIPSFLLRPSYCVEMDTRVDSIELTSFLLSLNLTKFVKKAYSLPAKVSAHA